MIHRITMTTRKAALSALLLGGAFIADPMTGASSAIAQPTGEFARYAASNQPGQSRIDYAVFDDILGGIVFESGHSDRNPGRSRASATSTGTRINLSNNSRYRYEGNRVVFHALTREHRDTISEYRRELESLPGLVDIAALPRDEQLAFWLNLHNAVVLDELAQAYPVRLITTISAGDTRARLHDAKIIDLDGHRISLNDIRFNIVAAQWPDPLVIYGFFSGAVGGPNILGRAYTGGRVWNQLEANANEYVNALRGVESAQYGYRISPLYEEWRAYVFPNWPTDLYGHLSRHADSDTAASLGDGEPDFLRYDWSIADLTNGVGQCRGNSNFDVQSYRNELGPTGQTGCGVLPAHAQNFVNVVTERRLNFLRQGRMGSVTVRDIPTDSEGRRISETGSSVQRVTPQGDAVDENSR